MPKCELCGAREGRDISGKARRLEWLKGSYSSTPEERQRALAERIMDLVREKEFFRCAACTTCGCCFLADAYLAECAICGAPVCPDCSLPALRVDEQGRIIEGSDEGKVLCWRCNPPSGGTNARLGLPAPVKPLAVF